MNIFIGSSSRNEITVKYKDNSMEIISLLASIPDLNLVYGGYNEGIMNISYEQFLKHNKKITAVTPTIYKDNLDTITCDTKIITATTFDRLKKIYEISNVFLFLPGGIGTLAELFSVIEENRTSGENKLVIIYNKGFFFTPVLEELYKYHQEYFISESLDNYFFITSSCEEVILKIKALMKEVI